MKTSTLNLIGIITIMLFIEHLSYGTDSAIAAGQDAVAKFLNSGRQADANAGLVYSQDKLIGSVQRALVRGDHIPPDIMARYNHINKHRGF